MNVLYSIKHSVEGAYVCLVGVALVVEAVMVGVGRLPPQQGSGKDTEEEAARRGIGQDTGWH